MVIYGQYEDQLTPKVMERFVFDMQPATGGSTGQTNGGAWTEPDEFLINWEEEARRALVLLDQTIKGLKPLRDMETSFKIFVETSETAFVEMTNNSKLQVNGQLGYKLEKCLQYFQYTYMNKTILE